MPTINTAPPGLDAFFRPDEAFEVTLEWPEGSLDGRTFTATLDGDALDVSVVADSLLIAATAEQTPATVQSGDFVLTETTGGASDDVLAGRWGASERLGVTEHGPVEVTIGDTVVQVSVVPQATLSAVTALDGRVDRLEARVEHRWDVHDWSVFTPVVITADGDTDPEFTLSVSAGAGVVSNADSETSLRVAYLRDGTEDWVDSGMRSLFLAPATWNGNNVQQGHLHRVRALGGGVYEGVAIWTSVVFGGTMANLHCKSVRFDGTTLAQSGNSGAAADPSAADSAYIDRTLALTGMFRSTGFGLFFNNYVCIPNHLYGLAQGDIVTIDSNTSTYDETNVAVNGAAPGTGRVQVIEPTTQSTTALAVDTGTIRPSSTSEMKRWAPFWMATRVIGDVVYIKRWRPEEGEPSWSNARVQRVTLATDADVPSLAAGPGACGLWAAHFYGGSSGSWGDIDMWSEGT